MRASWVRFAKIIRGESNFPAGRELSREFSRIGGPRRNVIRDNLVISIPCTEIT
jgi:hypothetical protein